MAFQTATWSVGISSNTWKAVNNIVNEHQSGYWFVVIPRAVVTVSLTDMSSIGVVFRELSSIAARWMFLDDPEATTLSGGSGSGIIV
ncbi:hypothetical protein A2U01_0044964, partial [Trifolium medium]|nr:hypothetical protein [Trifolium medium]